MYIDLITDKEVRLRSISSDGEDDGYEIRRLKEIFRVDYDGKYENKIKFLNNSQGKIFRYFKLAKKIENNNIFLTTLRGAKQNNLGVTLWLKDNDNSVAGYIKSINLTSITLSLVDDYGQEDGLITLNLKEITAMSCNTRYEQKFMFLKIYVSK